MSKPMWVMHIPVISTQHMPSSDALEKVRNTPCATYDSGGFLWLDCDAEDWTAPILVHLRTYFDGNWVRFDADADIVEGLTVYEWSEK